MNHFLNSNLKKLVFCKLLIIYKYTYIYITYVYHRLKITSLLHTFFRFSSASFIFSDSISAVRILAPETGSSLARRDGNDLRNERSKVVPVMPCIGPMATSKPTGLRSSDTAGGITLLYK